MPGSPDLDKLDRLREAMDCGIPNAKTLYRNALVNAAPSLLALARQHGELRAALTELADAVDAHKRYWPRVDWASELCERRIFAALATARALGVEDG